MSGNIIIQQGRIDGYRNRRTRCRTPKPQAWYSLSATPLTRRNLDLIMLVLALSVCLANSPVDCKDVHLTFMADNATPMQCMLNGQPEIAKWTAQHPKWQVRKWRCVPASRLSKTA